jgi:hypothetical protein
MTVERRRHDSGLSRRVWGRDESCSSKRDVDSAIGEATLCAQDRFNVEQLLSISRMNNRLIDRLQNDLGARIAGILRQITIGKGLKFYAATFPGTDYSSIIRDVSTATA